MERLRICGIISIVVGIVIMLVTVIGNYPFCGNFCMFCALTFWLIVVVCFIVGLVLIFYEQIKVKIEEFNAKHSE